MFITSTSFTIIHLKQEENATGYHFRQNAMIHTHLNHAG